MTDEVRLATAQENGNSVGIEITGFSNIIESHLRTLFVAGTFDNATVKYQISHDSTNGIDGTWFDVANADAITEKIAINVEHRGKWHRINVSGGTAVEVIDAWVV